VAEVRCVELELAGDFLDVVSEIRWVKTGFSYFSICQDGVDIVVRHAALPMNALRLVVGTVVFVCTRSAMWRGRS
jgi:hypothetical protein